MLEGGTRSRPGSSPPHSHHHHHHHPGAQDQSANVNAEFMSHPDLHNVLSESKVSPPQVNGGNAREKSVFFIQFQTIG